MIPSLRTVRIFGAVAAQMLPALFVRATIPLVGGLVGAFLLALLVDALRTRGPAIVASRVVAHSLALGVWSDVTLRVEGATRPCQLTLYDHHPIHGVTEHLPQTLALEPDAVLVHFLELALQRREHLELCLQRAELVRVLLTHSGEFLLEARCLLD